MTLVHDRSSSRRARGLAARASLAVALLLSLGTAFAFAGTRAGSSATTPVAATAKPTTPEPTTPAESTTPAGTTLATTTPVSTTPVATTPVSTTPVAPTTPVTTSPRISSAATASQIVWTAPDSITEERAFTLKLAGTINGQATAHIAVLDADTACPASPLYPQQLATGTKLVVSADPSATRVYTTSPTAPTTSPAALGGTTSALLTDTPKESGTYRLCGWVVGSPATSAASTVSRFDQVIGVANHPATLNADIPDVARSGDYFSIQLTGRVATTGRRVLIMGESDHGQTCDQMRKLPSGKRPLQSVATLPGGDFSKTVRVRFESKAAGSELVCAQIVETVDQSPEATAQKTMTVSETLKCTTTQAVIAQTVKDLATIRNRRDAALAHLGAAKKRVAPLRARVARQEKLAAMKIATAHRARARAKSAAGRKKTGRRLAAVKRNQARNIYRSGASLRALGDTMRGHQRSYNQYHTGAKLLGGTLTRTRKDLRKYCSPTGR